MLLQPVNLDDLVSQLRTANAQGNKVAGANLASMNRLIEHVPEDMTCTVESGMNLKQFQSQLATNGQCLPIDPPHAGRFTVGEFIGRNLSGPRRFGYGTIRDYLIGIKVVLADGRVINAGGKVVKNVAGYDLCKLFVGSDNSLGIVVEANFKLRPLPAATGFVGLMCEDLDAVDRLIDSLMKSELTPTVMDLHNLNLQGSDFPYAFVIGFEGSTDEVDWQLAKARELGIHESTTSIPDTDFWDDPAPTKISILPSQLTEHLRSLGNAQFIARAGNGIIYHRGRTENPHSDLPVELFRRVKSVFDPNHTLPEL